MEPNREKKYPLLQDIDVPLWCEQLSCSESELLFCIEKVGTSWVCVEAFWQMNSDRIRATLHPNDFKRD